MHHTVHLPCILEEAAGIRVLAYEQYLSELVTVYKVNIYYNTLCGDNGCFDIFFLSY